MTLFPFQAIANLLLQGFVALLMDPILWLVFVIIGLQYWQMQKSQLRLFGIRGQSLLRQIALAAAYGLTGGFIASFLLTVVGLTVNRLGLNYLWMLAIFLMMIQARFICFAYAGGVVALSSLLFGWPEVDVPPLIALIAILHITESFLIFISGRFGSLPLIIRREDGRMVGGFSLQNYWPLPLVLLAATGVSADSITQSGIHMPDWWPLISMETSLPDGQEWMYFMVPAVAALGYGDMAIASLPVSRRRRSALHLSIYSLVLLGLALLAARYPWVAFVAALASPLGHELVIQRDTRREMDGEPLFVPPPVGIRVLDTVPGSQAWRMGVKTGDVLLAWNGQALLSRQDLAPAIEQSPEQFTIRLQRAGKDKTLTGKFPREPQRLLGVIPVPEGDERMYVMMDNSDFWILTWLKRRWRQWKNRD